MNRKLISVVSAAALALSVASGAVLSAEKKTLLKVPVYFGTHLTGLGSTPKWLADHLNVASGGSVKIKVYEPGKLIPPKEILESVASGKVNAGYTTPGYNTGVLGAKGGIFSAVPFGPDAPEFLAWIYYGEGRKLWQEMYDKKGLNVHSIPCGITAPETSGWFNKPIDKPADLQGLRMRFFGLGALVMEKMGVSTSLLPSSEIFPALEKGAIDATEFSMPAIDKLLGFHKILKFNYYPGWHQPATVYELLVNGDTWKGMGETQQGLLEMSCKAAMLDGLALGEAIQFPQMKENLQKNGVENRYWSPEILDAFEGKWNEVVAEESAKDPEFKAIWDNMQSFRSDYAIWNKWAFLPRPGTVREQ
ncbi:TRAP transporter substrate-binding protein [Sedimenticola selenatireducens]|uniref:TRAP transporter substrate-binding protein n=1 Tax=Sedimenticola selenatireducens TaxID=191960 RepID=UPI002AAB4BA7|nr:TRAP transporter substrate-binding protein [Sedimenticola selenatireducens]